MEQSELDLLDDFITMGTTDASAEVEEEVITEGNGVPSVVPDSQPSVASSSTSTPEVIEEVDDAPLSSREKQLIERLNTVTEENLSLQPSPAKVEAAKIEEELINFLGEQDLDEVLSSPENLNKLLFSVYQQAMNRASQLSAEQIMRDLPGVISTYVTQHITTTQLIDNFYKDNQDLSQVKPTVAAVANEISKEHPEYNISQLMEEAAKKTRTILRLRDPKQTPPVKKSTPAFTRQRSGQRVAIPELAGLEKEIDELINL